MKKSGKTHKRILKFLYRSFDADLSQKKSQRLEDALKRSKDLREERELILSRRKVISENADRAFRPYFADRVMAQISALGDKKDLQESFYDSLLFVFKRLAVVGALVMMGLIFFNIFQGHIIPMEEAFFASDLTLEKILNLPIF